MFRNKAFAARITMLIHILAIISIKLYSQTYKHPDQKSTSEGNMEMVFIRHGSLVFIAGSQVIYIDHVATSGCYENMTKAVFILITRDHFDHFDANLTEKQARESTVIYCNNSSVSKVKGAEGLKAGDRMVVDKVSIYAVEAYMLS